MPEIRALVVDDEPLARRAVRQLLAPYPDIVVVGECRDGYEALRALVTMAPDLVFLDVEMPGLSGLELIRAHGVERMPVVVFVTAYDEFAVRAFETRALDYLVKPIGEARFRAAISRVRERIHTENAIELAARLTALLAEAPSRSARSGGAETGVRLRRPTGHVAVQSETGELFLAPNEIDWIEVNDYHMRIHAGGQEYGKHHGHWSAVRLADGQILDEYRVVDEGGETIYMTTTLRAYNAVLDRWELIGTNAGYGLQDTGTARRTGTEMLIEQEFGASSGSPSRWRIRYYDIREDRFSWAGDRSTDGGETWEKNHLTIEAHRIGPARFLGPLAEAKHRRGLPDAPERAVAE